MQPLLRLTRKRVNNMGQRADFIAVARGELGVI